MNTSIEKKSVWWREPMAWLIFTLPMLAVVAGLTTVWIAYKKADTLVADYDSEGVSVTQANEMDKRAHYLGLSADLAVNRGILAIRLNGKLKAKPQQMLLKLAQAGGSTSGSDIVLTLQPGHAEGYYAVLPAIQAGQRKLVLEPENRKWRLTGSWGAPFSGTLHLGAKSVSDSSMLP